MKVLYVCKNDYWPPFLKVTTVAAWPVENREATKWDYNIDVKNLLDELEFKDEGNFEQGKKKDVLL